MSELAVMLIGHAHRKGTKTKYKSVQRAWIRYCKDLRIDHTKPDTFTFVNFLASGFERKLKWGTLRSYVPALSSYLRHVDIYQVRKLLRGVFNLRPPVARYTAIWDVNTVLDYLGAMRTDNMKDLSMKLATLLMILSGNRVNMLTHFSISNMFITEEECTFVFSHVLKNTRPGFNAQPMTFRAYPFCDTLCPVKTIWQYVHLRNSVTNDTQFFVTTTKKNGVHRGATSDTIARWIKEMLGLSGIDSGKYPAHSCRSASTSAALFRGINLGTIIKSASWSNVKTFKTYYLRDISSAYDLNKQNFGECMLDNYVNKSV